MEHHWAHAQVQEEFDRIDRRIGSYPAQPDRADADDASEVGGGRVTAFVRLAGRSGGSGR